MEDYIHTEPLKANRWVLSFEGMDIPSYAFKNFKLYNEGSDLIFKTNFFETVNFIYNPADFFEIVAMTLQFLDPVGDVIGGFTSDIKGTNFIKTGDYFYDDLLTTELNFTLKNDTIKPIFPKNNNDNE